MKLTRFVFVFALMLFTATALAAKQEKTLICHVGNETGPAGETYLDDPTYDAGKIDLIVVANADKHLDNSSHYWDGISDYEPSEVGASGDGTEDSDGNGIDDGCEPTEECPCWEEIDLLAVTVDNHYVVSCDSYNWGYPDLAGLQGITEPNPSTFFAWNSDAINLDGSPKLISRCAGNFSDGHYVEEYNMPDEEANACIAQIFARCEELGRSVGIPD